VHRGKIGSADQLLRGVALRDELATAYGICAVKMEGSGIAVGADLHDLSWFMIRGVVDYCDNRTKTDVWHPYAGLAAACYLWNLLGECPPLGSMAGPQAQTMLHRDDQGADLRKIVAALLALGEMTDDLQRRAVLARLPTSIRTSIPEGGGTARLHVVALVDTCQAFPNGKEALLEALELALGAQSPRFNRVSAVIEANWRPR
jgi:hypothetical protein